MNRRLILLAIPAILILVLALFYLAGAPRLVSYSPGAGAGAVAPDEPLRLVFSRPMQAGSVAGRLALDPAVPGETSWEGKTLVFRPTGGWPSGATIRVRLAPGAQAAGFSPFDLRQGAEWSFTIGHPRLLYLYPADGPANVYRVHPSSGEIQQITTSLGGVLDFQATAGALVYSARNGEGGSDIFRLQPWEPESPAGQGGTETAPAPTFSLAGPEVLVACGNAACQGAALSPGGDFLAYEQTAALGSGLPVYPQVWLLPMNGGQAGGPARLAGAKDHQTLQPAWSPTGLLTFYDTVLSAFIVLDPATGEQARFPNETGEPGAWSPSGKYYLAAEIFYSTAGSQANPGGLEAVASSRLIRFQYPEGISKDLSGAENLEDAGPAFSPDGSTLAFARKFLDIARWTPGRQIWLMPAEGGEARQMTNDPYSNHYNFAWSPEGDELAYVRFNQTVLTDPPEVWVMDLPEGQSRRMVSGGYAPQWVR